MQLTEKISIVELSLKVLEPARLHSLERSIGQFKHVEKESARKLSGVLAFKLVANQETARQHPATKALMKATGLTRGPAVIAVASPTGYNSDALLLALEQLREKGYRTVMVARQI